MLSHFGPEVLRTDAEDEDELGDNAVKDAMTRLPGPFAGLIWRMGLGPTGKTVSFATTAPEAGKRSLAFFNKSGALRVDDDLRGGGGGGVQNKPVRALSVTR